MSASQHKADIAQNRRERPLLTQSEHQCLVMLGPLRFQGCARHQCARRDSFAATAMAKAIKNPIAR